MAAKASFEGVLKIALPVSLERSSSVPMRLSVVKDQAAGVAESAAKKLGTPRSLSLQKKIEAIVSLTSPLSKSPSEGLDLSSPVEIRRHSLPENIFRLSMKSERPVPIAISLIDRATPLSENLVRSSSGHESPKSAPVTKDEKKVRKGHVSITGL